MIHENPATGLPVLPDGYFWRVTGPNIIKNFEIQIRLKRRIGSKRIADWHIYPEEFTPAGIREAARCVVTLDREWRRHRATVPENVDKSLLGDYPPKLLRRSKEPDRA